MGLFVSAAADEAYFLGIGDLPGGAYYSEPHGISPDGSAVVGLSEREGQWTDEAFRWTRGTGMTGLGWLGPFRLSDASAASVKGSVVVGSSWSYAFRWTQQEGMVALTDPNGIAPVGAGALGISWDGRVAVGYAHSPEYAREAFRWTPQTGIVFLGRLPGGATSLASAVSADGAVIAGSGPSARFRRGEAFRWENAQMTALGALPGDDYSAAYGISGDGRVIIGRSGYDVAHGFRWTAEGGMVDLGGRAAAVSWDGSVIAGGFDDAPAFLDANGWHDLRTMLIDEFHLDLSNWDLGPYVYAMSADGKTFVGQGLHYGYGWEGWVAHIPEPASLALLALAAALRAHRPRPQPVAQSAGPSR